MNNLMAKNFRLSPLKQLQVEVNVSLSSENVSAFREIYSENTETIEWMYRFGSPLEKIVAGLIKYGSDGMSGVGLQVLAYLKTWNISITFLGV